MDFFSLALGLSMVTVGVSVLAGLAAWAARRASKAETVPGLLRLARLGALASLPLVAFSLVFHFLTGHRPDTPQGMSMLEFVLEHPSLIVVVVLAALVLWRLSRARV